MSHPPAARQPPDPPLGDAGILLRVPSRGDAQAIASACRDPEIARWVPVPVPYTLADAASFLDTIEAGWTSGSPSTFAIVDRSGGHLLGMISLEYGAVAGRAAVGYWIAPGARRRGIATRAVRLVAAWAFEDPALERLELTTLVGNVASGRVALGAGFAREGILRQFLSFRGTPVDAVMFARVRSGGPGTGPAPTWRAGDNGAPELRPGAASVSLNETLDEWERAAMAVGSLAAETGPAAEPLVAELLDALREEVARRSSDGPFNGPGAEAADRRDAIATLLADLGLADPTEPADALAALGWDGNEVDDLLAPFGTDEARLVVAAWLAAGARARRLLAGR